MKSRLDPLPKLMRSAALGDEGRQMLVQRARQAIKLAVSNMPKLLAKSKAAESAPARRPIALGGSSTSNFG